MIERFLKDAKGFMLLWVLLLMSIMMIFTIAAITVMLNHTLMSLRYTASVESFHYAEAGVHHYLAYLNNEEAGHPAPPFNEPIPYDLDGEDGFYLLEVIDDEKKNEVCIRSTGWTAKDENIKRVVEVVMRKRTFTEYVYFSDNDGDNIWWFTGENCYGPYHTNTNLRIYGSPVFYGPAYFVDNIIYYPSSTYNWANPGPVGSNAPQFRQGLFRVGKLNFPSSNNELYIRAQHDGYVFEGRTSIRLNPNGTITVRNKDVNGGAATTMPLPGNGVIYVNGASVGHPAKFSPGAGNVFVSGELRGRLTIAAANNIYITGRDPTVFIPQGTPAHQYQSYYNSISATGGIRYASTTFQPVYEYGQLIGYEAYGDDMLGLIADKNIYILTKGWFLEPLGNAPQVNSAPPNVTIHAALFAIDTSFANEYENYNYQQPSPGGKITLRGALIQKVRGIVGIGTTTKWDGYQKDYAHDTRMLHDAPPYFLEPEESGWETREWKELGASD